LKDKLQLPNGLSFILAPCPAIIYIYYYSVRGYQKGSAPSGRQPVAIKLRQLDPNENQLLSVVLMNGTAYWSFRGVPFIRPSMSFQAVLMNSAAYLFFKGASFQGCLL